LLLDAWRSGRGLTKLRQMIRAQGGDDRVCDATDLLPSSARTIDVKAVASGVLIGIDAREVGTWITEVGGGRLSVGQPIDPSVGVERLCPTGEHVTADTPVLRLHLPSTFGDPAAAARRASGWIRIGPAAPSRLAVLEVIDPE
jgi:pyrimidine-nucleoside phosphorylase